jgi:hypothetical protein
MEKEQWKEEILNSFNGIQRAQPGAHLYEKIRTSGTLKVVKRPYIAAAAACLVLLISANIWMLRQKPAEPPMVSTYQVDNANFDLY